MTYGRRPMSMAAALGAVAVVTVPLAAASADQIAVPQALERKSGVEFTYRLDAPLGSPGQLDIEWTDTAHRMVEHERLPVRASDGTDIRFSLDLRRAVTRENMLTAKLSTSGSGGVSSGPVTASFFVAPETDPWSDYQIIMWQEQSPQAYEALRVLGVTAGIDEVDRATGLYLPDPIATLSQHDLGFYLENIATDFYSPYHRYYEGKPVNWRYLDLKERYRRNRHDLSVFVRDPSLSDPRWLSKVEDRLAANVRALGQFRPLFYNLADEPGVADLAVNWDFDLSPISLWGMRQWLADEYGTLDALNAEWGLHFAAWSDVMPETTDQAMDGPHDNFAAWADFKTWMDVAFARAIAAGTSALHEADPHARSAIEGGQIPGGGGWDYGRLAGTVDVMELYDFGDNVELARSFAPQTILLTTSHARGPIEQHRVWRELLRGTRGLILWDDAHEFVSDDGVLGGRGREAAPYFAEIRNGLGALLIGSERQMAPIAILYSQASQRVQWMLDRLPDGVSWTNRNSSDEYGDNAIRTATRTYLRQLEHMGFAPVFVSSQQLERGELRDKGCKVLVLPHAIALSRKEATQIRDFVAQGGMVLSDGEPGIFDQHGRKMARPQLRDLFSEASGSSVKSVRAIELAADSVTQAALSDLLNSEGVAPDYRVQDASGQAAKDVETYVFRRGGTTILALLRDAPAGSWAGPAEAEAIEVPLPHPSYAYDLRARQSFGRIERLVLSIGPFAPRIITLSDAPFADPAVSGPSHAQPGALAEFHLTSVASDDVLNVEVVDPSGHPVPHYSGNVDVSDKTAAFRVPFALNDQPGTWLLHVRDMLSGTEMTARIEVVP